MRLSGPLLTVLMPVYNAAPYLEQAIRSILEQTFEDFEFLIFNDGSTDNSVDIINNINDRRIRLFNYEQNCGYVTHLNMGLQHAAGKYIARMDSDDIALPERFAKQIDFMESHPEVGVCGTAFRLFGSRSGIASMPTEDIAIREFMLCYNPLGHPTVMMRSSLIKEYELKYSQDAMPTEDYLMWYEFSKISMLKNLPDVLLSYRTHEKQISNSMYKRQHEKLNNIRWLQLSDKGFNLNQEYINIYFEVLDDTYSPKSYDDLEKISILFKIIIEQNRKLAAFPEEWFVKLFSTRWYGIIRRVSSFKPSYIRRILISPPIKVRFTFHEKMNFLFKSLLFRNS